MFLRFFSGSLFLLLSYSLLAQEELPSANTALSIRNFTPWTEQENVTGNWGGLRPVLVKRGVELGVSSINDVWGNTMGGLKTGSVSTGVIQLATGIDFEKLIGWKGGSFYSRWLYLSGENPQLNLTGDIFGPSNIAGTLSTLTNVELWFQQKFFGDLLSLRIGQLVADSEFVISDYAALFLNNTLGWPAFIFANVQNGGPAYPMGSPGIRLKVNPFCNFSLKMAAFQNVDTQNSNPHGFNWNANAQNGLFYITEATYDYECGLPGRLKAGAWLDSGTFFNLNNTDTSYWGNNGFYGVIDQMLYRKPTNNNALKTVKDQGLGTFARIAFAPQDRNLLSFYCDTGLSYKGLLPKRDQDTCGIAFGYGQLGSAASSGLQSQGIATANGEMLVELTYQALLTRWLAIQPDIQYIVHPNATQALSNALVIGVRATVTF